MRTAALAGLLLATVAIPAAAAEEGVFWTAPAAPVAGQPLTVLVSRPGFAYDEHTADNTPPQPQVRIEGDAVLVDLGRAEASEPGDAPTVLMQLDLPALEAGDYALRVYEDSAHTALLTERAFSVAAPDPAAEAVDVQPVRGHWYNPAEPGTGFALDVRNGQVMLSHYTYSAVDSGLWGHSIWFGLVTALRGGEAVGALLEFERRSAGVCLDFDSCLLSPGSPSGFGTQGLRLAFESDRRGWVEFAGGRRVPIVSMPFGVDYVAGAVDRGVDGMQAPLYVPEIAGEWVIADAQGRSYYAQFEPFEVLPIGEGASVLISAFEAQGNLPPGAANSGGVDYRQARGRLSCEFLTDVEDWPDGWTCWLEEEVLLSLHTLASFRLANIAETSWRGERPDTTGEGTMPVRAFRIGAAEVQP